MRNIALSLRFDGGAYHGWQVQAEVPTVAAALELAIEEVCGRSARVLGCSRTDAGVHAYHYCAGFRTETRIPAERLPLALNSRLPEDIAVLAAEDVEEDFSAIRNCRRKEYVYRIHNSRIRDPFLSSRSCFYPVPLDREALAEAARQFEGTHDFAAVRSLGTETNSTVRTVHHCRVSREGDLITFAICADGFLYNMARAIVGTCVYAAHGKFLPSEIPALLIAGDRRLTGPTMPPQGLCLQRLWYDRDTELFRELRAEHGADL